MDLNKTKSRLAIEIDASEIQQADIAFRALGNSLNSLARRKRKVEHPAVEKFRKNATRMMRTAVEAFALFVYDKVTQNTPIGDATRINENFPEYMRMYMRRWQNHGVEMKPGFHKGAWQYSDTKSPEFNAAINDLGTARKQFISDFRANYKPGQVFYVSAKGTAFAQMERGYIKSAPDGVIQPTIQDILAGYKTVLQSVYDKVKR